MSLGVKERGEKPESPAHSLDCQGHQGSRALMEIQVTQAIQELPDFKDPRACPESLATWVP